MSKKKVDEIAAGLKDAIAIARGEIMSGSGGPSWTNTPEPRLKFTIRLGGLKTA